MFYRRQRRRERGVFITHISVICFLGSEIYAYDLFKSVGVHFGVSGGEKDSGFIRFLVFHQSSGCHGRVSVHEVIAGSVHQGYLRGYIINAESLAIDNGPQFGISFHQAVDSRQIGAEGALIEMID